MRVTSLARRLGTAALVLSLGTGLAACSGDDSGSSGSATDESTSEAADDPSDEASDEASDDPSDEATDDAAEEPAEASLTELGADDFYPSVMAAMKDAETFTFETTTDTAGQTQAMSGQARFTDAGVEMRASSTGAQPMETILLGKVMYMKSPQLGTGDKWLKIDLSDPNSPFGMIGKATDPEVMFKAMEAPKKLELVGSEDVDGVEANHYRVTLDPARFLEAMEFPAAMADMLPEQLVTEMWIDADNLPRRFSQTMQIPAVGGGEPTTMSSEGTYSDFGTEVEIEEPPAGEVTEDLPGA